METGRRHSAIETESAMLDIGDRKRDTRQWRQEMRHSAMETGSEILGNGDKK